MKNIKIEIDKAQLTSFSVELKEDMPEVSATITLYTKGGKAISTYSLSTNGWDNEKKFDLPVEFINPIKMLMEGLETIIIRHCRQGQKVLSAPKE